MTSDPRDYKLDVAGVSQAASRHASVQKPQHDRPFLSVLFKCCAVYQRVYRNASGDTYEGRCPRCGLPVRFVVAPGGTSERSFVVE